MKKSKKREKKKFKRQNLRYQNISIKTLDQFDQPEIVDEKRAEKKTVDKSNSTLKSDVILKTGRIIQVKSNYLVMVQIDDQIHTCNLGGRLKQINFDTRNVLAVGDFVQVDVKNEYRIESILPRKNALSRFSEFLNDQFQKEIIVAANIDQVIITASIAKPEISFGLIDRYICAARIADINPILCINKVDLIKSLETVIQSIEFYRNSGIKVLLTSVVKGTGLAELKQVLQNNDSVFSGHSGAGKSSLINALQPDLKRKVANISKSTQKGTHTTTNSCLIRWHFGGNLIDTPGIKTFGLQTEDRAKLPRIFPGFDLWFDQCQYPDCSHTHEKNCAIKLAVFENSYPTERYQSYLRLYESLELR